MLIALPRLRRLTTTLSIALVVIGALVSGHAQATHLNGLSAASSTPCHHALDTGAQATGTSNSYALDLCRQLCLNKIPDTAITTAIAQHTTSVLTVSTQLAYTTIPTAQHTPLASAAPTPHLSVDRTRPPSPLIPTRLLI